MKSNINKLTIYSLKNIKIYLKWFKNFNAQFRKKLFLQRNPNILQKKINKENAKLLHHKFKRNLNRFSAYRKQQEEEIKKKKLLLKIVTPSLFLFRLKKIYFSTKKYIFRKSLEYNIFSKNIKYIKLKENIYSLKYLFKKIKNYKNQIFKNKLKIKLTFFSKKLLSTFLFNLKNLEFNTINSILFNLIKKYYFYNLKKIKRSILLYKFNFNNNNKLLLNKNFFINNFLQIKFQFNRFIKNNIISEELNLNQHLNIVDLFKNIDDISRSFNLRSLCNKENNFIDTFYYEQNPICLLTTITGHNLYLTLYISKPYKIIWKGSSGMLNLKKFRKAKKHQNTFKDLIIRSQLFLAKYKSKFQRPLKIIFKNLNYFGNNNLLRFFLKKNKHNELFSYKKNYKLFNFFKNTSHLINNHVLKFMSSCWIREKKFRFPTKKFKLFKIIKNQHKLYHKFFLYPEKYKPLNIKLNSKLVNFFKSNPYETTKTYL
jgi:hypothetical protein